MQVTSYSLIFGADISLSIEIKVPSLWIAIQENLTNEESVKIRLIELETLDEVRLTMP